MLNWAWCFAQEAKIACLQASLRPEGNTNRLGFKKMLNCIGQDKTYSNVILMRQHFVWVWNIQQACLPCSEERKSWWSFCCEHDSSGVNVWWTMKNQQWHCFASCRKSFSVRWCTTSILLSYLCLSGEGISLLLYRKRGQIPWPPRYPDLT